MISAAQLNRLVILSNLHSNLSSGIKTKIPATKIKNSFYYYCLCQVRAQPKAFKVNIFFVEIKKIH